MTIQSTATYWHDVPNEIKIMVFHKLLDQADLAAFAIFALTSKTHLQIALDACLKFYKSQKIDPTVLYHQTLEKDATPNKTAFIALRYLMHAKEAEESRQLKGSLAEFQLDKKFIEVYGHEPSEVYKNSNQLPDSWKDADKQEQMQKYLQEFEDASISHTLYMRDNEWQWSDGNNWQTPPLTEQCEYVQKQEEKSEKGKGRFNSFTQLKVFSAHLCRRLAEHYIINNLTLNNSDTKFLSKELVKLSELKFLELIALPLKNIPHFICEITTLTQITITSCQELTTLPTEMGKLTNLQSLRLSRNRNLERLPDSLLNCNALKHVSLEYNPKLSSDAPPIPALREKLEKRLYFKDGLPFSMVRKDGKLTKIYYEV